MRKTTTALLGTCLLAVVPVVTRGAPPAAAAATATGTATPEIGAPHPRVPGMYFFGEYGWGKLTFTAPPPRQVTFYATTPWFTDAVSASRVATTRRLLGEPVIVRSSPLVPSFYNGRYQNCRYIDPATGRLQGYDNYPCEHRNFWLTGPQNGFSYCFYKKCQTVGHNPQGGWSTFRAHDELWSWVETVTLPPIVGFEPCGPACDDPRTGSTPTTVPRPSPDLDRDDPCPPAASACPPPVFCDLTPEDPRCNPGPGAARDVHLRVVIDAPAVFVARGTFGSQSATVRSLTLFCGPRPCDGRDRFVDIGSARARGRLDLVSASPGYPLCASARSLDCSFLITGRDATPEIRPGDAVTAIFFSPTRAGESLRIRLENPTATVVLRAELPELEWRRSAGGAEAVRTGRTTWQPTGEVPVPVEVYTAAGTAVGADGLSRIVIGTIGTR